MERIKWLLGFLTLTPWKMLLASVYYLAGIIVLTAGWFTPALIPVSGYDLVIYKISVFVIFLWIESPAVFLSDTPLRQQLPFFRNGSLMHSITGMMIVCVVFVYLFASIENLHTETYKEQFNRYMSELYQEYPEEL